MKSDLKIMIIEDEYSIRESLQWYLEDLGHIVSTAESPESCIDYTGNSCRLKEPTIDALIVDHHLPNQLGLDLLEQLNDSGYPIGQNVILMSGDTTSFNHDRAKQLGITIAQKPMSLKFLKSWINRLASRKKMAH
jgi:DNA-binding response OmpR family regulator